MTYVVMIAAVVFGVVAFVRGLPYAFDAEGRGGDQLVIYAAICLVAVVVFAICCVVLIVQWWPR